MTQLKAQTLAAALKLITGYQPTVAERPDGTALLMFPESDLPAIRKAVENLALRAGRAKSDVSIAFAPIVTPMALKYALPAVLGVLAAGGALGYAIAKKL